MYWGSGSDDWSWNVFFSLWPVERYQRKHRPVLPAVSRWPRQVWCWSSIFRSWGWVAARAHSSRTGGESLSHDTVWTQIITTSLFWNCVNFESHFVSGHFQMTTIYSKNKSTHYLCKVGNWKQLVQSNQKLPQQLLQFLVKLWAVIHRKLLLTEEGRIVGRYLPKKWSQRRLKSVVTAAAAIANKHNRLTLKNCSLSSGSVSSVWTNERKLSTVLRIFTSLL